MILTYIKFLTMALEVGYSRVDAAKIACIARYESDYNTEAVNQNTITKDHGILQINDIWLDEVGACNGLNPYNPYESLICAKRIIKIQGYEAWHAYKKYKSECDLPNY